MAIQKGLGRGLSSLIPIKKTSLQNNIEEDIDRSVIKDSSVSVLDIDVDKIKPNPMQPRQVFEQQGLDELVESIKQHGILQPLVCTKTNEDEYELIAGERRLRAAKIAQFKTVPVIVRDAGEMEKLELALIENILRKDLNPIEKAESYYRLMDEFSLTQEEAAKRLGKTRSSVANTVRLLTLPVDIQKALIENIITEGHARALLGLEDAKLQKKMFRKILKDHMNVRNVEAAVGRLGSKIKKAKLTDPNIEDRKNNLQAKLGTKVEIKKQGDKGQVVIHFYSEEEFRDIVNKIIG